VRLFAPKGVDADLEAQALSRLAGEETNGLVAVAGAPEFLRSLPIERWAIVTSAERQLAQRWLSVAGLPEPKSIIAAEDVSRGKPDPEGYLLAARKLGCAPSELIVFEDAPSGLAAAKAAGSQAIAVRASNPPDGISGVVHIEDFTRASFTPENGGLIVRP
jgi:mannitol-1-/sugar-/sorbitol-6-phosphatase